MRHYFQFLISACMAFVIACTGATAEEYPNRPVRILVGTAAGSGPDVLARSIAAQLSVEASGEITTTAARRSQERWRSSTLVTRPR